MAVVESTVSSLVNVSGQLPLRGSLASMQVCIWEQSCDSWIERVERYSLAIFDDPSNQRRHEEQRSVVTGVCLSLEPFRAR
jgi:hypothetical protein